MTPQAKEKGAQGISTSLEMPVGGAFPIRENEQQRFLKMGRDSRNFKSNELTRCHRRIYNLMTALELSPDSLLSSALLMSQE